MHGYHWNFHHLVCVHFGFMNLSSMKPFLEGFSGLSPFHGYLLKFLSGCVTRSSDADCGLSRSMERKVMSVAADLLDFNQ